MTDSSSSLPKYDLPSEMKRYANSKTSAALAFCGQDERTLERGRRLTVLVTATSQSPSCRTWKKVVEPSVISGAVGGVVEAMTWMRKMSEMERLGV